MSENGKPPDWIKSIHLKYFTAFEEIEIEFSPGINFFIGENGTGKTHLLKLMYFLGQSEIDKLPADGIESYFFSYPSVTGRWNLINLQAPFAKAIIEISSGYGSVKTAEYVDRGLLDGGPGYGTGHFFSGNLWDKSHVPRNCIFIPAKEMLSHIKGFVANLEELKMPFERHYRDILSKASVSPRIAHGEWQAALLASLQAELKGPVLEENGMFFIATSDGPKELTLVAEGHRKLALYWLLLNNGMLDEGSILFIDEPEANLNPKLMGQMVDILLELQRHGVQIFVASHSFVMFKSLEQHRLATDQLRFHALYRDPGQNGKICCESQDNPLDLVHDPILDAYNEMYDRDIADISARIKQGN